MTLRERVGTISSCPFFFSESLHRKGIRDEILNFDIWFDLAVCWMSYKAEQGDRTSPSRSYVVGVVIGLLPYGLAAYFFDKI